MSTFLSRTDDTVWFISVVDRKKDLSKMKNLLSILSDSSKRLVFYCSLHNNSLDLAKTVELYRLRLYVASNRYLFIVIALCKDPSTCHLDW